ncbi:BolA family protein [Lichenihabitans psoromatis]|uniref:BolA family protein n=1 Tax=Lichenihabitans psoromatis TaxID=2528642 RepID=UPI001035643E|nr:BolA family protein [Lichenihabitans psoromatis]
MTVKDTITTRLQAALRPTILDVVDESHLHAGHSGSREGGETHFRVVVAAEAFNGKSRVERHRMVNALLEAELRGPVHALALDIRGTEP